MRMIDKNFWKDKKVFITGHTGFKGAWLYMWLSQLGANVTGYSLAPPTSPNLYDICKLSQTPQSIIGDIRNKQLLKEAILLAKPDIIFHLAAQPLVRDSYRMPVETYETNVMGTVNLFDAVREAIALGNKIKAIVNVTTDKCYENKEWEWGYRENDSLGGYDPYSNSKACSELVTSSFRNAFFPSKDYDRHGLAIATARAGNVIGGGDWSDERLIPDCIRSLILKEPIIIRNPYAIRPWQHVLEPLSGYLILAQKLYQSGTIFDGAWNFGPQDKDCRTVSYIVEQLCKKWKNYTNLTLIQGTKELHEAQLLKLDCSKAITKLGWKPRWDINTAIDKIVEWTETYLANGDVYNVCMTQITEYSSQELGEPNETN
jgi:CDP-glucose 4,6-dehydratase